MHDDRLPVVSESQEGSLQDSWSARDAEFYEECDKVGKDEHMFDTRSECLRRRIGRSASVTELEYVKSRFLTEASAGVMDAYRAAKFVWLINEAYDAPTMARAFQYAKESQARAPGPSAVVDWADRIQRALRILVRRTLIAAEAVQTNRKAPLSSIHGTLLELHGLRHALVTEFVIPDGSDPTLLELDRAITELQDRQPPRTFREAIEREESRLLGLLHRHPVLVRLIGVIGLLALAAVLAATLL